MIKHLFWVGISVNNVVRKKWHQIVELTIRLASFTFRKRQL